MKSYTDKVLTVIAVCLVIQTLSELPFFDSTYAAIQEDIREVSVCDFSEDGTCADIYEGSSVDALYVKVID